MIEIDESYQILPDKLKEENQSLSYKRIISSIFINMVL